MHKLGDESSLGKRKTEVALLLWGLLLCLPTASKASEGELSGCPEVPTAEKEKRQLAGEWFSKAQALAKSAQYTEALSAFQCSIRMVEHPDTVFNAAQAAALNGDTAIALQLAERYLILAPDGEVAAEAEKMIAELKPTENVGAELVDSSPSENTVTVTTTEPPAESKPKPEQQKPQKTTPEPEPSAEPLTVAGYVSIGLGGAGLVAGAVLQGLASKAWSDGKNTDNYDEFVRYKYKLEGLQTGALVGLIAGGIVTGAGTIMELIARKGRGKKRVGIHPAGLGIYGRF